MKAWHGAMTEPDAHALALELHSVLSEIDPVRWRDEMGEALSRKLARLAARFSATSKLEPMGNTLRTELAAVEAQPRDVKAQWLAFKQRVQPAYASMAASLRAQQIHLPSLRPTNYARNAFHVASAAAALTVLELVPPNVVVVIALVWAGAAWAAEAGRRLDPRINAALMRLFHSVSHPHEATRVNSATWYATALLALALTASTPACVAAVTVLGVGDPLAAVIGRRFGRTRLMHGRSLEGTLGFVVSATLAASLTLSLHSLGPHTVLLAFAAAASGAVAELVSLRVDDNFSIPLSAAAGLTFASWVLHLL